MQIKRTCGHPREYARSSWCTISQRHLHFSLPPLEEFSSNFASTSGVSTKGRRGVAFSSFQHKELNYETGDIEEDFDSGWES